MTAYYNENEPFAAQWLRNLISAGHIAGGDVDERDIRKVTARELAGYTQYHFFAGIGIWSHALRRAGWPDNRPVWTGSCPCQPFSSAGLGAGFTDERHLWPEWFRLIRECTPRAIFGEQVAGKDGAAWVDLVHDDLESAGYAVGAIASAAAGYGAPMRRERLYFMAHAASSRQFRPIGGAERKARNETWLRVPCPISDAGELAGAEGDRHGPHSLESIAEWRECAIGSHGSNVSDGGRPGSVNGYWRNADWLRCSDGRWRPVEPGTFPLAHGYPGRVGRLRAYGNAICAPHATEFIKAAMDLLPQGG